MSNHLTGHVFMAQSLDGFIARPDNSLDWLEPYQATGEDHGYDGFIATMDCLIMGRNTYETVKNFDPWPYALPVIVLSTTLQQNDVPDHIIISNQTPTDLMTSLATLGWSRAYIDGGKTIQSFLAEGLIRDMTITTVPVLIGQGTALFGPQLRDVPLKTVTTRNFPSGLVQTHYHVNT